jgi:hypothetical protein
MEVLHDKTNVSETWYYAVRCEWGTIGRRILAKCWDGFNNI